MQGLFSIGVVSLIVWMLILAAALIRLRRRRCNSCGVQVAGAGLCALVYILMFTVWIPAVSMDGFPPLGLLGAIEDLHLVGMVVFAGGYLAGALSGRQGGEKQAIGEAQ